MAKKVKKTAVQPDWKALLSTEIKLHKGKVVLAELQNESLSEQLAGLQEEVMDLVEANEELNDHLDSADDYIDELEDRNTALQNSLVDEQFTVHELTAQDDAMLAGMELIFEEVQKVVAERDELRQDNHHLTIQLAAAKDKVAKYKSVYTDGIFRFDPTYTSAYSNAGFQNRTATGKVTY